MDNNINPSESKEKSSTNDSSNIPLEETKTEEKTPFYLNRKYIKRSFGFMCDTNIFIQGNPFKKEDGSIHIRGIDVDGLYGNIEYTSLEHLKQIIASDLQFNNLLLKISKII